MDIKLARFICFIKSIKQIFMFGVLIVHNHIYIYIVLMKLTFYADHFFL